ncbi:MAG: sulfotransferase family protein [Planctomycetales bacterium]|nr:sulfotransferase family protein [Planctomycetales bacterium]
MSLDPEEIIIVSGMPRSGTSLMMRMLALGGIPVLTDNCRPADSDNPHGYFEYEPVKRLQHDASWLPRARGRAVKIVAPLLAYLPEDARRRIIWMERSLDEIMLSQQAMLRRSGQPAPPQELVRKALARQATQILQRLHADSRSSADPRSSVVAIDFRRVIDDPHETASRLCEYLNFELDVESMATAVDPTLYRQRTSGQ